MGTLDNISTEINVLENDYKTAHVTLEVDSVSWPPRRPRTSQKGCENRSCVWSPDGQYIAWSCGKGCIKLLPWNSTKNCLLSDDDTDFLGRPLEQDRRIRTLDSGREVYSLVFSNNKLRKQSVDIGVNRPWFRFKVTNDLILAAGLQGGLIRTWNVRTGESFLVLMDHTGSVHDLQFAPDGSQRLLSTSADGSLKLWELDDDGNMSCTLRPKVPQTMLSCGWSPDCKQICGAGDKRGVYLWKLESKEMMTLRGHLNVVTCCRFSPDGVLLLTSSYDTMVMIWNVETGEVIRKLHHLNPPPKEWLLGGVNSSYVHDLSVTADGRYVLTICDDGKVRVWDIFHPEAEEVVIAVVNNALSCSFSPGGANIGVGLADGGLLIFQTLEREVRLQALCRTRVRRSMLNASPHSQQAVFSILPNALQDFLLYKDMCY